MKIKREGVFKLEICELKQRERERERERQRDRDKERDKGKYFKVKV